MVCAFYKQGQCSKGDKCKFSHDIAMDRKGEKRSLYVDARDVDDELKNGNMSSDSYSVYMANGVFIVMVAL